jgi:hypothetical protein
MPGPLVGQSQLEPAARYLVRARYAELQQSLPDRKVTAQIGFFKRERDRDQKAELPSPLRWKVLRRTYGFFFFSADLGQSVPVTVWGVLILELVLSHIHFTFSFLPPGHLLTFAALSLSPLLISPLRRRITELRAIHPTSADCRGTLHCKSGVTFARIRFRATTVSRVRRPEPETSSGVEASQTRIGPIATAHGAFFFLN